MEIVRETNLGSYPTCNALGECASYWRFVGIQVKSTYSGTVSNPCPTRESGSGAQPYQLHNCGSEVLVIPDHNKLGQPIGTNNFTYDRMYVHGSPTQDVVIGFDLDCIACSLIDSYVSDIHASNTETQAANAEYTPGPLKIHNNYLSAGGESFFIGGSGAIYSGGNFYDDPYVTRDVEISNNQIEAQIEWDKCGDGGTVQPGEGLANGSTCPYPPTLSNPSNQWIIKNNLEFKSAQRVLVTGNLIQNAWLSGQTGSSILFEPAGGESGNSTVVQDITLENNIDNNADTCITYAGQDYNCEFPATGGGGSYPKCTNESRTQRINFYNNLCIMNPSHDGGASHVGIYWTSMAGEAVFNHNTILMSDGSFPVASLDFASQGFGTPSPTVNNFDQYDLYHLNNLLGNNPNGDAGNIPYYPMENMGWYEPNPSTLQNMGRFTGNVLWVPTSCNLGIFGSCEYDWNNGPLTGNDAVTSVTYTACGSPSYGNYQLASPNWAGETTDGYQAGVICSVLCATGVCNGTSTLSILTTSPPSGTVGVAYSYSLAASGGNPPYTWTISAGSLPPGLSLVGSAITGTPTATGTSSFTLKVTDSSSHTATANLSITIASGTVTITTTAPPNGAVGIAYSYSLAATGGTPPYTWSIISGSLPPGLGLTSNVISGTPTAAGTSSFTVKVTDSASNTATAVLSITINPQQQGSTTVLTSGQSSLYETQATTLTATVSVTGSEGAPTGTVNFMLGSTVLGTGTLIRIDGTDSSASMQLQGSQLVMGPNSITAVYSGDNNYAGSTSPAITVTLLNSDNNFGTVEVGMPAPLYTFTYTFKRNAQLTAINILTMGVPGLDYRDGGSSTCMVGIPYTSSQSCTVSVAFTPTAPGLRSGSITLFAQGSNLPLIVEYVTGVGEAPAVTIDPGTQTTLGTIANATTYGSVVDGAGNVYVADKAHGQVVKIAAGTQQQSVVVSQLSAPTSVALDGAGNLYIAESTGVVMVPNENGTLNAADMMTLPITGLGLAQGIAEDGSGNLYVADNRNGTVIEVAGGFGTPVTLASGLTNPHGVAVDAAGNLYVSSDNQVAEYPVGGGTAIQMGTGYRTPQDVAVDASGTVYVADTGNAQIVKVAAGGQSQSVLTVAGLVAPHGVALDATADVYVSDSSSVYEVNRVQAAALSFGNIAVGTTSPAQTLQVSNVGNQHLMVSALAISPNFIQQPSGGSDCSSTTRLAGGTGCEIAVAFSPTISGVINGTVGLTDNALDNLSSQQTVALSGTGTQQQQQQTITFPNPGTQTYGVAPITLTATASSGLPVSYTVLSGPATVNGSLLTITGAGSVTVQANQSGNSQWQAAPPVNDTFTVNPAVLTVTANNASMTYGGTLPTFTASYSGFVNGDGQGVLSGAPSLTTTATSSSPVGNYTITAAQGTLSAQNYTFAFVNGTLNINPAVLTVTANNASMTYGGALPTFTASYTGFVNGDGQGVLSGAPSLTTTATSSSPVGNYPITAARGTLSAQNYTFAFANGTLTINPAVLTVTANNALMTYGGMLPTLTASYTGFVNGDGQGVLSGAPSLTTTATSGSPVGNYPITAAQGTLSAQNYTFTFVNGTLTIVQAASATTATSGVSSLYQTQATTLTAIVSVTGSGGAPTGTVNFMLGSTLLGTGTLTTIDGTDSSASMQLQGSQLVPGPNSITAVYSGDNNYAGSTSPAIIVTLLNSNTNFGTVEVGTPAPVQTFTYTFNSNAQLSAINILTMGVAGLDYQDGGSSTCTLGTPYTAGQSCTVSVGFTPSVPGLRAGSVTLFAQGTNVALNTWYVSGIGQSPAVTIDPGTQTTLGTIASATTYGSAIDGAGNVYVADKTNRQVVKIAAGTQQQSIVVNRLSGPTSVALDGAGNLYIAETTTVAMVPNENGTLNAADIITLPITGLGRAQGIAEDGSGNLYVADKGTGNVIEVPGGTGTPVTLASGLTNPHGVTVDAAGNVYVSSDNQVAEYPAGGGAAIQMGTGYRTPQDVAVDASGTVYVADTGNAQIVRVAAGGQSQSVLTVTGLVAPHGITVDTAGDLYVSDSSSVYEVNRVQAAALNFGNIAVGTTSPAQILQVSNIGNQQLTVSGLAISPNFTQQPSGGSDCSSITQLTGGGGCEIAVAFSPTISGVINGTVGLTDNALNNLASQQSVSLTGTGTQAQQQPQTITFPNPGTQTYGVAPITLTATASSGLPVSYTVLSGPATVNGSLLTITGAGSVTVQANQAGNSQWQAAPPVNDTFTVNPAVLTVTANNASMTYGGNLPTFTASYSGFVNGDGQGVLSGAPSLTTTASSSSPVGNYPITAAQGTLTAQNYTFTFANGTLTINKAVLTVTANNASMTYGGTLPAFTASYTGFVNGDGQGVLSGAPSLTTTATAGSPVGNYTITAAQGTLSAQNYSFAFVSGTLSISPAVLTVTANNLTRQYGQNNPTFTYTMTGFLNGDTQGTATSGAPNLTTTATTTSPLGNYAIVITQGSLTAQNYTFVFVNGTLTIVQASTAISWIPRTLTLQPGEMLGPAGVLDATVSPNIPGTWRYSVGINGHIIQLLPTMGFPVGVYRVIVAFTPQDQTDYATPAPVTQTFTVTQ